jgi:hypothetical protein
MVGTTQQFRPGPLPGSGSGSGRTLPLYAAALPGSTPVESQSAHPFMDDSKPSRERTARASLRQWASRLAILRWKKRVFIPPLRLRRASGGARPGSPSVEYPAGYSGPGRHPHPATAVAQAAERAAGALTPGRGDPYNPVTPRHAGELRGVALLGACFGGWYGYSTSSTQDKRGTRLCARVSNLVASGYWLRSS